MVVLIVFLGVNYDINTYTVTNRYVKGIFISLMSYLFIVFVILVVILHYIFDYQVNSAVLAISVSIACLTKHIVYSSETRHSVQSR